MLMWEGLSRPKPYAGKGAAARTQSRPSLRMWHTDVRRGWARTQQCRVSLRKKEDQSATATRLTVTTMVITT